MKKVLIYGFCAASLFGATYYSYCRLNKALATEHREGYYEGGRDGVLTGCIQGTLQFLDKVGFPMPAFPFNEWRSYCAQYAQKVVENTRRIDAAKPTATGESK